jgi:hypothetical protein
VTDSGIVFADSEGSVYMWPLGAAAPQNVSTAANSTGTDVLVQVHYPWVLWSSSHPSTDPGPGIGPDIDELVLYNTTDGQQFDVHAPSGVTFGCYRCDFATLNGQLALFYWTYSPEVNVYRWDQASNTSVALTSDGKSLYPQTDGVRVAWQTNPQGPGAPPFTLTADDLSSSTRTTVSTSMVNFQLADGLLGWVDQTLVPQDEGYVATSQAIRASDGTTTATISTVLYAPFYGSSGGYVFFEENNKLYAWSFATGRRLLFDSNPGQVRLTGKTVYFTSGSTQTLYGVTLP